MKILALHLFGFLLCTSSAFAGTDVCVLAKIDITKPDRFTSGQINTYKLNLKRECELAEKYQSLKGTAKSKFGIELTDITVYQALRYVERYRLEEAAIKGIPVAKIYQRHEVDYNQSNDQKSSEVWDNFNAGIKQLAIVEDEMAQARAFDLARLLKVHEGFFTLSDETGDYSHIPFPGVLKPPAGLSLPWWPLKESDVVSFTDYVSKLNAIFRNYGLLASPRIGGPTYWSEVLSVHETDGVYSVYSGDSRASETDLNAILKLINAQLNQTNDGEHMVVNGNLVTPGQLAYLAQQFYVDLHSLYEGNGRTSRFIQELILTSSGLPHGSSGDLMAIDVLTLPAEYYQIAIDKNFAELDEVSVCLDSYKDQLRFRKKNAKSIDPTALEYRCRILN